MGDMNIISRYQVSVSELSNITYQERIMFILLCIHQINKNPPTPNGRNESKKVNQMSHEKVVTIFTIKLKNHMTLISKDGIHEHTFKKSGSTD